MLVALTVTPALGLMLMAGARLAAQDPPLMRSAQARVRRGAQPAARRRPARGAGLEATRWVMPAVVAVAIVGGLAVYPHLGEDLFPTFKEPDFLMHFVTKPGTSVADQARMVTSLQKQVLAVPGVTDAGSHIGIAIPGEEVNGVNFSETWVSLSPSANYDADAEQAAGDRRQLPGRVQRRADLPARADR